MKSLAPFLLAALTGCASQAAFRPSEVDGQSASSTMGAYYEVSVDNRNFGDVKVWSSGAREDEDQRFVELVLRVRNDGAEPLLLDLAGTGVEMTLGDKLAVVDTELAMDGGTTIAPGQLQRITLRYSLPGDAGPRDIDSFDFFWRLATPGGVYTQSTPFERARQRQGSTIIYQPAFGWGYWGHPYWRPWP